MKRHKTTSTRAGVGLFLLILMAVLPVGCGTSSDNPESTSGTEVHLVFPTQQETTRALPANTGRVLLSVFLPESNQGTGTIQSIPAAPNLAGIDLTTEGTTINVPVGLGRIFQVVALRAGFPEPGVFFPQDIVFSGFTVADVPSTGATVTITMNAGFCEPISLGDGFVRIVNAGGPQIGLRVLFVGSIFGSFDIDPENGLLPSCQLFGLSSDTIFPVDIRQSQCNSSGDQCTPFGPTQRISLSVRAGETRTIIMGPPAVVGQGFNITQCPFSARPAAALDECPGT